MAPQLFWQAAHRRGACLANRCKVPNNNRTDAANVKQHAQPPDFLDTAPHAVEKLFRTHTRACCFLWHCLELELACTCCLSCRSRFATSCSETPAARSCSGPALGGNPSVRSAMLSTWGHAVHDVRHLCLCMEADCCELRVSTKLIPPVCCTASTMTLQYSSSARCLSHSQWHMRHFHCTRCE